MSKGSFQIKEIKFDYVVWVQYPDQWKLAASILLKNFEFFETLNFGFWKKIEWKTF